MTREDVIKILDRRTTIPDDNYSWEDINEAIDIAIEALEQEPSRDMEEIEEAINCDADAETKCKMISDILIAKPHYFEKQTDVVSRQAILDCKYAISDDEIGERKYVVDVTDIVELPPVTPTRPIGHCKDCKHMRYWSHPFGRTIECSKDILICPTDNDFCSKYERK